MFETLLNRAGSRAVALETTLLLHGVPAGQGKPLARDLASIIESEGATAALCGVVAGVPTVGMSDAELDTLLASPKVPKANSPNLGVILHNRSHGATTVSTTMELAAAAGVRVFATGGLGGVHRHLEQRLDISADLFAFTRFPVAVVTSGCKSLLDVENTREMLETLGIPVIGFRTNRFPAFYLRESEAGIDARFDSPDELANFVASELRRTGRGIVVANPIPEEYELSRADWDCWLASAQAESASATGRDVTPALLGKLHTLSGGLTLKANVELVRSNARLAGQIAARMA